MSKVKFEINTIHEFNTSLNNSYNILIGIIKEMKKETDIFKENGQSKTLNLFNEFMEKELKKQVLNLSHDQNKYNVLFNNNIIPLYEELCNQTKECVGNDNGQI